MTNPALTRAYQLCRTIAAEHGRTYFLATRLLPAERRPAVHALYAFARMVDDIIDVDLIADPGALDIGTADLADIERALADGIDASIPPGAPTSIDTENDRRAAVLAAVVDTIRRYDIPVEYFTAFMVSMRMDVPGTAQFTPVYESMEHLRTYMYGSAAVIGLQMLPILGTVVDVSEARPTAAALGEAFQLTNFIRDVGEDLDRGRIYLPADELAAFGVDEDLLRWCRRTEKSDRRVDRAVAHLVAVTRAVYRTAEPGIGMLEPRARAGIGVAFRLYADILDTVEDNDFRVLTMRAVVPVRRRVRVAVAAATGFGSPVRRPSPALA